MSNETTLATQSGAEAAIRNLVDAWQKAVVAGDIDRIMTHYAPDILAFDAVSQLQFKGVDTYRKHWLACMEMCKGGIVFEVHQLAVTADEEVAFAHYLTRCGGKDDEGGEKTSWMRATVCLCRVDERWKIAHEHFSVPFDMQSGKAMFDLKP